MGISLPLYATQFFALLLSAVALVYYIRILRKEGAKNLTRPLVTVAFGLIAAGIAFSWVEAVVHPLSGEVSGQLEITDASGSPPLTAVRVALLDFHGENMARESGIVDSKTGYFALTYKSVFWDYPRTLRISAQGYCEPQVVPLERARLRMGSRLLIPFSCKDVR